MSTQMTEPTTFGEIPCIERSLFEVRKGIPSYYAVTEAICLVESIERLARAGHDEQHGWLISFAADAIRGLLHSVEHGLEADENQCSVVAGTERGELA